MAEKKSASVGTRIPQDLRDRLDAIHDRHLTDDSAVVQALLTVFCDEAERLDAVRFPVTLRMSEPDAKHLKAAEESGNEYQTGKRSKK